MKRDSKTTRFPELLGRVSEIVEQPVSLAGKLQEVAALLKEDVDHYDWVGFYLVDQLKKDELVLGPFVGEPTEHIRIAFGHGICGQAAERKETFMVEDVSRETNYLSCSPDVKSEIVVPIFVGEEVVGELDIDSHRISPFAAGEREFLEKVCDMLSGHFKDPGPRT